jgi:hypothetical protein
MHSPLVEPVLNGKEVGLEFLGGSCRMALGLSALRTDRALLPTNIIFLLLVLISVRG